MQKNFCLISLAILICFGVLFPHLAEAKLLTSVQLGYGVQNSEILGYSLEGQKELSTKFGASYAYNDLLFTSLYQGTHPIKGGSQNRSIAQIGANYLFLAEEALQVYGGLGYQYISNGVSHNKIEGGDKISLAGHGFAGQVVVSIPISDQIKTSATITGNPWMKWSLRHPKGSYNLDSTAPSFLYQLDLTYDISADLGAHLGLLGGSFRVPDYSNKGKSKSSYSSINLGVTWQF